jgi:hypothetical protein
MKVSTKAALVAGARKAAALLFSALCIHYLINEGSDWFWVTLLLAAQWSLYHSIEELWFPVDEDQSSLCDLPGPSPPTGPATDLPTTAAQATPEVVAPGNVATIAESEPQSTTTFRFPEFSIRWGTPSAPEEEEEEEDDESEEALDDSDPEADDLATRLRREELISALRNLQIGNRALCTEVADHIINENPEASLENLIRKALQLTRRK